MQNLKPKQNPTKLTDTENGLVVARGKEWKVGEMGEEDAKLCSLTNHISDYYSVLQTE